MRVRYLNIGDPVAFGFQPPFHLVEAATRAMRDGHNGYLPSAGIPAAREAVAADYRARGVAMTPDRVLITTGTSEAIDLALNALVDEGDEVLVPSPTYPLYTAVMAKINAQPNIPHRPGSRVAARYRAPSQPDHVQNARAGHHRPQQPHGGGLPAVGAAGDLRSPKNTTYDRRR